MAKIKLVIIITIIIIIIKDLHSYSEVCLLISSCLSI